MKKSSSKILFFWIFILGSIIGCYYEEFLHIIKYYFQNHALDWEARRGVLYGPISPIYGAGACLMAYILLKKKRTKLETFLMSSLIGGAFEYIVSFLQETFLGSVSWDYSNKFLNINGRTTIPFMIVWGFLGLFLIEIIIPRLSNFLKKSEQSSLKKVTLFLFFLLCFDCFVSWSALIRQALRRNDIPPITVLGDFYDKVYPDSVLKKHFPNMEVKKWLYFSFYALFFF